MSAYSIRTRMLVGVVVTAALVMLFAPVRAAATGDVVAVGWWTDRTAATSEAGGFEIAAAFDGTSVAAVRLVNEGDFESATLVLTEAGVPPAPSAAIVACTIAPGWVPADAGSLDDAPATACEGGLALTRQVDRTWSADLTGILPTSGQLDLALVPAGGPLDDSPLGDFDPGFTAQFASAGLTIVAPEAGPSPTTSPATAPPPTVAQSTTTTTPPATPPPTVTPPRAILPAPAPAPTSPPPTEAPPVTQLAPPVDESAAEELSVPSFTTGPISGSSGDGKPWIRLVGLIPLSAAVGAGTVFVNRLRDARS